MAVAAPAGERADSPRPRPRSVLPRSVLGVRIPRPRRPHPEREPPPWSRPAGLHPAVEAAGVVALFALLARRFCAPYFPLDGRLAGGPGDFEPYTAMHWIVAKALLEHHQLPLWHPYAYSGLPLIGDAYISFFNPAVVLPFVFFGAVNGGKVAAVVALALSGAGQYWLSRVLGQGRVVSLVAGVLGLTAGTLVARLTSGFNFSQSMQHAWMALSLASFLVAVRTRRPGAIATAALCYALLFHAANVYLWLLISVLLVLFGAGYAVTWTGPGRRPGAAGGWSLGLDWGVLRASAAVAVVGVLLMAVQLLPLQEIRERTDKPIDVAFRGTQPLLPTLFNFVNPDFAFWQNGLFGAIDLGWGVYYAYIGAGLFPFLLFLVPAFQRRPTRDLPLLATACVLTLAWAAARHTVMWEVWQRWDVMQQLRYWATATHATTIVLIPLALAGADYLWRRLAESGPRLDAWGPAISWPDATGTGRWRLGVARAGLWLLLLGLLWGVAADPWRVNGRLWNVVPPNASVAAAYAWLRQQDGDAFTVHNHEIFARSFASYGQIDSEIQVLNSIWLFKPRPRPDPGAPDGGVLVPAPRYVLQRPEVPPLPGTRLLHQQPGAAIYGAPAGLPFAFVADPRRLPYGAAAGATAVTEGRVFPAVARWDGPNRLVVRIPQDAPAGLDTLVVMQTAFSGWRAQPAGEAARPARSSGGFLSLDGVRPGQTVTLSYLPGSFVAGAALSLLGVLALAALFWLEVRGRRTVRGWGAAAPPAGAAARPPGHPADRSPA